MKSGLKIVAALAAALTLAGCASAQDQRAVNGALLGGGAGALIGAATTGRASGAVVGGAIGAAAGGVLGAATTPTQQRRACAEYRVDYDGNRRCVAWY